MSSAVDNHCMPQFFIPSNVLRRSSESVTLEVLLWKRLAATSTDISLHHQKAACKPIHNFFVFDIFQDFVLILFSGFSTQACTKEYLPEILLEVNQLGNIQEEVCCKLHHQYRALPPQFCFFFTYLDPRVLFYIIWKIPKCGFCH